jgi:hypothetical protein
MMKTALVFLAAFSLLVGVSAAQLSGSYTVDPNGSGPRNYTSLTAAVSALGNGVSGPVTFDVKPVTFTGMLVVTPVPGVTSVNTVTFVTQGTTPAVIDGGGGPVGIFLFDSTQYVNFTNFKIQNFSRFGLYLFGFSPGPGVNNCTFTHVTVDAPGSSSSTFQTARIEYSHSNTFLNCRFLGGGYYGFYWQQMHGNLFDGCEFDGKGVSTYLLAPFNDNNADNAFQNCFFHDCSASGRLFYMNWSSYGNMVWNNTFIATTSQEAVFMGSCCTWNNASSWRNNIIVNLGTGPAAVFGETTSKQLERFDADYNCYYAPNASGGATVRTEQNTYTGSVAGWVTYLKSNPGMIQAGGGTSYDQNSIESDPALVSAKAPYDIHLNSASPLIDAGTSQYIAGPWITYNANATVATDFEGDPRGTLVDIGADEVAVRIVASGSPSPGGTVTLTLLATSDAGLPYQVGSSLGNGPTPIGQRTIGLSLDNLLVITVGNQLPTVFQNYIGVLDSTGQGQAKIVIPNLPALKGVRFYTAFVTLKPTAPQGIQSISKTELISIS